MKLLVTANVLNKRRIVPASFPDSSNISGTVLKGFTFEGDEVTAVPNPALGKWYVDRNGSYYWGGGLIETPLPPPVVPIPSFNIVGLPSKMPEDYRIGIDLSHHNGAVNWPAIKNAGVSFCFIKTSEGVGTRDSMTGTHTTNARQNNIKVGYYHFCRPDTRNGGTVELDAKAEAKEMLAIIAPLGTPQLPLVLDLEDQQNWDTPLSKKDYLKWIKTFIGVIKAVPGMDTIIYSRKEYLDRKLPADHDLGNIKLWIANYSQKDYKGVRDPIGWDDWAIWQYTESGVIGGTKLDINILKDPSLF